jgi:hypothetical protein
MSEIEFNKDFPYAKPFTLQVKEMGFELKYIPSFNSGFSYCFTLEFNKGSKRLTCNFRFKNPHFRLVGSKQYPYFKLRPYHDANSVKKSTPVLNGLLDTLREMSEINGKICEIQTVSNPITSDLLESQGFNILMAKNPGPRSHHFPVCA